MIYRLIIILSICFLISCSTRNAVPTRFEEIIITLHNDTQLHIYNGYITDTEYWSVRIVGFLVKNSKRYDDRIEFNFESKKLIKNIEFINYEDKK